MPVDNTNRHVSQFVQIGILSVILYYGMKWIVDNMDPTRKRRQLAQKEAEELLKRVGVKDVKLTDYEMSLAPTLIDPLSVPVTWTDIGGLDVEIRELKETVILPMKQKHIFGKSSLLSAPKGILLYGPPGCGKTMIAKATARTAGCRFINVQVSSLTDKWYGESQKLAAALFSLAKKIAPCIIFIDEIDSFLRSRTANDHEATAMMKAQFMSLWDGLLTDNACQIMVMGATNRPQDVDKAILRRMATTFHIKPPDTKQREAILKIILANEKVEYDVDYAKIAELAVGCSGSDLKEICRTAALGCVREYLESISCDEYYDDISEIDTEAIRDISTIDMQHAVEKCKKQFIH